VRTLATIATFVATGLILAVGLSKAFAATPSNCKLAYDAKLWDKAVVACRIAAKDSTEAQLYLGYLYYSGEGGVKRNIHTAATWAILAAKAGNEEAHEFLWWLAEEGVAVATDWVLARARAGDSKANDQLHKLLDRDMLPNTPALVNWLREKALAGNDKARQSLIRIYIAEVLFDQDIKRFDQDLALDYSACVKKGTHDCGELVWTFIDVNGDGLVARAELARFIRIGLKAVGQPSKHDSAKEVMQIKTVLFASGLVSAPVVARLIIENYDYDEDGRLSRKEIELDFPRGDPPIVALVNQIVFAEISKNMDDISSNARRIVRRLFR